MTTTTVPTAVTNTIQRTHAHENAFLDWIRPEKKLDSYAGYRIYDMDGLCWHNTTKRMMLLETKTHNAGLKYMKAHQKLTLEVLTRALAKGTDFKFIGTYLLTFENTCPEDGLTYLTKYDGVKWIEGNRPLNKETLTLWFEFLLTSYEHEATTTDTRSN